MYFNTNNNYYNSRLYPHNGTPLISDLSKNVVLFGFFKYKCMNVIFITKKIYNFQGAGI